MFSNYKNFDHYNATIGNSHEADFISDYINDLIEDNEVSKKIKSIKAKNSLIVYFIEKCIEELFASRERINKLLNIYHNHSSINTRIFEIITSPTENDILYYSFNLNETINETYKNAYVEIFTILDSWFGPIFEILRQEGVVQKYKSINFFQKFKEIYETIESKNKKELSESLLIYYEIRNIATHCYINSFTYFLDKKINISEWYNIFFEPNKINILINEIDKIITKIEDEIKNQNKELKTKIKSEKIKNKENQEDKIEKLKQRRDLLNYIKDEKVLSFDGEKLIIKQGFYEKSLDEIGHFLDNFLCLAREGILKTSLKPNPKK